MDYLVRCKEWVSGLVPAMTSDTTPEGQCFTDGYAGDNYKAYKAFNRGDSYWAINNTTVGHYIGYIFTEPKIVNSVGMITGTGATTSSGYVSSFRVEGSNDGSSWTALSSTLSITPATGYTIFDIDNNTSYTRYRIYTLSSQSYTYINTIQFYSSVVCSERAMYFIGQNNYASDTLLADTDWLDAIYNSQYMEYILNTKVPTMTNYTVPYGTVIESGHYNAFYGWHPFMSGAKDRTTSAETTAWYHNSSGQWIGYDFGEDAKIYRIETRYGHGGGSASSTVVYAVDYSTDGTTWEEIPSVTFTATISGTNVSSLLSNNTNIGCQAIRLRQVSGYGGVMTYLQFYGRTNIPEPSPEPSGYKALLPVMTAQTTNGYTVTSSTVYEQRYAWKTVAQYRTVVSDITTLTTQPGYINITFPKKVILSKMVYNSVPESEGYYRGPKNYIIYASNDNFSTLIELRSGTANNDISGQQTIDINSNTAYRYYRIYIVNTYEPGGNKNIYFYYWQLYGYEDTSIQYLYNNGTWSVGIENPGSNFNRSGTTYSQGATLASNKFTLPSVSSVGSLIGLQKVDLTNIKLVQVKCKGLSSTTSYYCILRISDGYNLDSSTVKYANITSNQEHTVPIDVSELTGYYYITLSCNINMSCEVYEIYLQK